MVRPDTAGDSPPEALRREIKRLRGENRRLRGEQAELEEAYQKALAALAEGRHRISEINRLCKRVVADPTALSRAVANYNRDGWSQLTSDEIDVLAAAGALLVASQEGE